MKFLDPDDPFFARAWVRWLTVLVPIAWGMFELFYAAQPMWGILFLAAGFYAGWMLFIKRRRD